MSSNNSTCEAVIDRIEESTAVLLLGPDEVKIELPIEFLPSDAEEGSILSIDFRLNRESTRSQRERISSLIEDLKKRKEDL
jgi:hypothetical protein